MIDDKILEGIDGLIKEQIEEISTDVNADVKKLDIENLKLICQIRNELEKTNADIEQKEDAHQLELRRLEAETKAKADELSLRLATGQREQRNFMTDLLANLGFKVVDETNRTYMYKQLNREAMKFEESGTFTSVTGKNLTRATMDWLTKFRS